MQSNDTIAWFGDIGLGDRPTVGGKGGSLGELMRAGIEVPPGFVVRTQAFEQFIEALEAEAPLRAVIEGLDPSDLEAMTTATRAVRERLEASPLPDDVRNEIMAAHAALCGEDVQAPVAVRSSATTEDAEDASFAGLQDTYLWVIGADEVLCMVRSCWASLYSVESVSYRLKHKLPESGVAMGVVVQKMVDARCAGVMFTRSPTTGDRSVVTIEGAWGLGSAVVSGEVTPDRWVVAKITGEIPVRDISDKHVQQVPKAGGGIEEIPVPDDRRSEACLSDEELMQLKDVALKAERHYKRPQDIEWAIDRHSGRILLLQSRPETVWSSQEAKPVATAAADPLTHVMSIFGGRR
jgi:pyruvate,water dikinase